MSFNTNTFYRVQSFGTDYNLAAAAFSGNSGAVVVQSSGSSDNALWQLAQSGNSAYALRTKAYGLNFNGNAYCVNTASNTTAPVSGPCARSSLVWNLSFWNGQNPSQGYYFTSEALGSEYRLYTDPNTNDVSMKQYNSASTTDDVYMQWGVSSISAINDNAWSTFPAAAGTTGFSSTSTTSSSVPSSVPPSTTTGTPSVTSTSTTESTTLTTSTTTSSPTTSPTTTTTSRTTTPTTTTTTTTTTTSSSSSSSSSSTSRPTTTTSSSSSTSRQTTPPPTTTTTPAPEPEPSTVIVTDNPTVTANPTPEGSSPAQTPTGLAGGPNAGVRNVSVTQSLILGLLGTWLAMGWCI